LSKIYIIDASQRKTTQQVGPFGLLLSQSLQIDDKKLEEHEETA